jgi:hypothetical protein
MQRYGIIKDGGGFIVQAEEQSILRCTSRRKAAKTISDANDLIRADESIQAAASKHSHDSGE